MLTAEQIQQYHQQGFLKGGRVLDDEAVDKLQAEIERVIRDRDRRDVQQPVMLSNMSRTPGTEIWQIVNIWEASEPFRRLVTSPTIAEEIAQLTGSRSLRIWHDQIQFKPASSGGQNDWHQDIPYWPVLKAQDMVTAWVALDDVDEENGCMSMVPQSQNWGTQTPFLFSIRDRGFDNLPDTFEGHPVKIVRAPVKKGHVHFHHGLTWHGSHANRSNRPRRAVALHYVTESTRYTSAGNHPMKPFIESADGEPVRGSHFPVVWPREAVGAR